MQNKILRPHLGENEEIDKHKTMWKSTLSPGTQSLCYQRLYDWLGTHVRPMLRVNHKFYSANSRAFDEEDIYQHGGRRVAGIFICKVTEPCILLIYCTQCAVTFVVQWDAHSPDVSMNLDNEHPNSFQGTQTFKSAYLKLPYFHSRSSKSSAEHRSLLLEWFTPFLSPLSLQCTGILGQQLLF